MKILSHEMGLDLVTNTASILRSMLEYHVEHPSQKPNSRGILELSQALVNIRDVTQLPAADVKKRWWKRKS